METGPINPSAISVTSAVSQPQSNEKLAEHRELISAVRALNGAEVFGQNQELTFSLDRDSRRAVLRIVDKKTGEVITQLPPEHVLRLAKHLLKP